MVLAAVLVPVSVVVLSVLILIVVCTRHCKSRNKSSEGTYDLPQWDRTGTLLKKENKDYERPS